MIFIDTKNYQFYRVNDVMNMLEIKQTKAYQIIQKLNKDLKDQGKLVVAVRVSKKYFDKRMY